MGKNHVRLWKLILDHSCKVSADRLSIYIQCMASLNLAVIKIVGELNFFDFGF